MEEKKDIYVYNIYFNMPRHSASGVLVDHNLAVASSEPVTSKVPSSDRDMQLMLDSCTK